MNGRQHELGIHVTECLGQCENDKVSIFYNKSLISNPGKNCGWFDEKIFIDANRNDIS